MSIDVLEIQYILNLAKISAVKITFFINDIITSYNIYIP